MSHRILVVEDEPAVTDLLAYNLRKAHYDVLTAAEERLDRWRKAAVRSGADADAVVEAIRDRLANDLDTPAVVAELDAWAANDAMDGSAVADAVDALLGVRLT